MAKRKRLSPLAFSSDSPIPDDLETKSMGAPPISGIVHDAASTAALEEMSQALRTAREGGRMVLELPLAEIQMDYLVRDRVASDPEELEALVSSLRLRGQQQPIEVVALGPQSYGLISGWRRCQALMQLAQEDGQAPQVLALLRRPTEASDAYLAMVEENEIRVGLSYYERARIVLRAVEQGVYETEKEALQSLFRSASRAKRSKIGSFIWIVRSLDGVLRFPTGIPERAGLALARRLEDEPDLAQSLTQGLETDPPQDAAAELAFLEAAPSPVAKVHAPSPAASPQEDPGMESGTDARMDPAPEPQHSAAIEPVKDISPTARKIAPSVWVQSHPDGAITLSGAGLTKARRDSLLKWIATNF